MKWLKKIWLSFAVLFLFVLPSKSKNDTKNIVERVNFVRKSIKSKDSALLDQKTLEIRPEQLKKDWVNWPNWGNWANWNNWNNWRNWNNWNDWGNWANY